MKFYLKILFVITIISYFSLLMLNYQIRTDGLDSIHPFWTMSIVVSALATLIGFTETLKPIRRFTFIDLILKVIIIILAFRATDADFTTYVTLNLLTVPLFIANLSIESFMILDYDRFLKEKQQPDISYVKMFEESQKYPDVSYEIQARFINAIKYSRTVVNILSATIFLIVAITSILTILKYHSIIAGILLGMTAIASILILTYITVHLFKNHLKIKTKQNKLRIYINISLILCLFVIISATITVITLKELSSETYLIILLYFPLIMPISMTNNRIASIWLEKINKNTTHQ